MKILIRIAIPLLLTLMSAEGRTEILRESDQTSGSLLTGDDVSSNPPAQWMSDK